MSLFVNIAEGVADKRDVLMEALSTLAHNAEVMNEPYMAGSLWFLYACMDAGRDESFHALGVAFMEATGIGQEKKEQIEVTDVDVDLSDDPESAF